MDQDPVFGLLIMADRAMRTRIIPARPMDPVIFISLPLPPAHRALLRADSRTSMEVEPVMLTSCVLIHWETAWLPLTMEVPGVIWVTGFVRTAWEMFIGVVLLPAQQALPREDFRTLTVAGHMMHSL